MKTRFAILVILLVASTSTRAQVVPAATGPTGLPAGTLHYDLRFSQMTQFYGGSQSNSKSQGDTTRLVASGEMTYSNSNGSRPFSVTYSGGDMWAISGYKGGSGVFQHMLISQGILGKRWSARVSDNVSYMPQAATTGFSGIPGVGDLPTPPSEPGGSILTLNTRSVRNAVNPSFTRRINFATDFTVGGSYRIVRFPDGEGVDINQVQVNPGVSRRLDAFNSITGHYSYARYTYPGLVYTTPNYSFSMQTQSLMFGYTRMWNRRFRTTVSAGPQWVQPSDTQAVPSSVRPAVDASAAYSTRTTSFRVGYNQGTSGGEGLIHQLGTHVYDVNGSISRQFGRNLTISGSGAYRRTQGYSVGDSSTGKPQESSPISSPFGGISATERLGRYFRLSGNYTVMHQSSQDQLPGNAVNGLVQVVGFSIGYNPRAKHLKK